MKKNTIFFLVVIFSSAFCNAQFSNYYNIDFNQNIKANINNSTHITGTIHEFKTISTIDYGALQLANAQREKNRLEKIKYADEHSRLVAQEVASNILKSYDYGFQKSFTIKGSDAKTSGFRSFSMSYRVPHSSVFVFSGPGRLENVSQDGITTEIIFSSPANNKESDSVDLLKQVKMENVVEGQLNEIDDEKLFIHKKDLSRATVFGVKGYKSTLIWEDDFQFTITDNFVSYDSTRGDGILFFVKVRTYGNKKEVTFEAIEGRRFFLRHLVEKVISTAFIYDMKF